MIKEVLIEGENVNALYPMGEEFLQVQIKLAEVFGVRHDDSLAKKSILGIAYSR